MSSLKPKSKIIIEEIFINSGYVLDFSNNTFQRFVKNSVNIDVYQDTNYSEYSSKGNKLRQIVDDEPNDVVVKLLNDLIDYFDDFHLKNNKIKTAFQNKKISQLEKDLETLSTDSKVTLNHELHERIRMISTRNAQFQEMSLNEKLKEILNLIENLLKINGNYISLDYEKGTIGLITEDSIKKYRKNLQCFRHSSEESISERNQYADTTKTFLIDYGISIINLIYNLKQT